MTIGGESRPSNRISMSSTDRTEKNFISGRAQGRFHRRKVPIKEDPECGQLASITGIVRMDRATGSLRKKL